jgi:hypothetical protein
MFSGSFELVQGFLCIYGSSVLWSKDFYAFMGVLYYSPRISMHLRGFCTIMQGLLCFQGWPDPCQCLSLRRGKTQWNSQGKIFPRDLGYKTFVRNALLQ